MLQLNAPQKVHRFFHQGHSGKLFTLKRLFYRKINGSFSCVRILMDQECEQNALGVEKPNFLECLPLPNYRLDFFHQTPNCKF